MIEASEIYNDKDCLQLDPKDTSCRIIMSETKRIVIYPCRNGELLNMVGMHEDNTTEPRDGKTSHTNTLPSDIVPQGKAESISLTQPNFE